MAIWSNGNSNSSWHELFEFPFDHKSGHVLAGHLGGQSSVVVKRLHCND